VLDPLSFAINLESNHPSLFFRNKKLTRYDAVVPRIGASITFYGTAVVRQFQQMGVYCCNSSEGINKSRDKLRCLQALSRHDVGIPPTAFVRDRSDVLPAIERVGGAPVIIKLLEGTQGVGVILAETAKTAEAIIETLTTAKQNVLIQKFVAESKGRDVRAFVVGDRVVGAMRRRAQGNEFRSNVHRGGVAEAIELEPAYARTAVRAAQIMGLTVAGVDMLESADGPKVMEVNSSPGLEGIEGATQKDIAGEIIDHLAEHVEFPELDIRQRLTVSPGFGVSEIVVAPKSALDGRTLAQSGLREQGVQVLTIERQPEDDDEPIRINNPDGPVALLAGDRLLCFGRVKVMKTLVPKRVARRVRKLRDQSDATQTPPAANPSA